MARRKKNFRSHTIIKERLFKRVFIIDGERKIRYYYMGSHRNNGKLNNVIIIRRYFKKKKKYGKLVYIKDSIDDSYMLWELAVAYLKRLGYDHKAKRVMVLSDFRNEGLAPILRNGSLLPLKYLFEKFEVLLEDDDEYTIQASNGKIFKVEKFDFEDM